MKKLKQKRGTKMTKIQLTTKQHEEIQEILKTKDKDQMMDIFSENAKFWFGSASEISKLLPSQMARVLYEPDSYEVVIPIQKGSFVRSKSSGNFYEVSDVNENTKYATLKGIICQIGKNFTSTLPLRELELVAPEVIRHEKERKLWAKIGREVGEFREGDIRINDDGASVNVTDVEYAKVKYVQGKLKGFFPVGSFVDFEEESE